MGNNNLLKVAMMHFPCIFSYSVCLLTTFLYNIFPGSLKSYGLWSSDPPVSVKHVCDRSAMKILYELFVNCYTTWMILQITVPVTFHWSLTQTRSCCSPIF